MKVNFGTKLKTLEGKPIKKGNANSDDATLGSVSINALLSLTDEDRKLDALKKFEMGKLAKRIYDGKEIDLKAEEITLIKKRIGMMYPPLVVFRAYELLDK